MPSSLRVLVVEDDPAIRRLLHAALARAGYAAEEAATAREALALLDAGPSSDAVLLDLGLPDRDGLELVQLVKARGDAVLLIVSARTDTAEKVAALDLGADDYLPKPFDTEELLARIRTALRHRRGGTVEGELCAGAIAIDLSRHRVTRSGEPVHLTPKEFAVLAMLARQPDRVVGHAHILRTAWGPAQERHLEYLRLVIRGLRQKLEDDPARPALIVNEPGIGYRLAVRDG